MDTIIVNNPAIDYFLSRFRNKNTSTYDCNVCVETISIFLAGEASKYLRTKEIDVKTPLGTKLCPVISEDVVLVPVLRAGVSMLSGFQRVLQKSSTGFIWAHRREDAVAELDKYKFPSHMRGKTVIILDTMLATGETVNLACDLIRKTHPRQILCASILSVQSGIDNLLDDISAVITAGTSDHLDGNLYICPGVGDSGDRLYE